MKSGTAQKLVLNMISTTVMLQLGRVEDNKMVNMQLSNDKLIDRGTKMLMERVKLTDYEKAKELLAETWQR
jgi:N-acetylmuramic acid 6-phosphate etherase